MTWHLDPALTQGYVEGSLSGARAASVEAHLLACEQCRESVAAEVPATRLASVWVGVQNAVDAPRASWVERLLGRLGVQPEEARLLAAAPSLRISWLLSICVVMGFVGAAPLSLDRNTLGFLVLAPLIPVLGVACAYGRGVDPTYEMTRATPYPAGRLLLLRAAAVLVASIAVMVPLGFVLSRGWQPLGWLLPSLALVGVTLVAARWLELPVAGAAVVGSYLLVVVAVVADRQDITWIFSGTFQLFWLAAAVGCAVFVTSSPAYRAAFRRTS